MATSWNKWDLPEAIFNRIVTETEMHNGDLQSIIEFLHNDSENILDENNIVNIVIPPGEYLLHNTINLYSFMILKGNHQINEACDNRTILLLS